jgi:hypothetical protein
MEQCANYHVQYHRYYTQVFLAQVILSSPDCIPGTLKKQITDFMEAFLERAAPQPLQKLEQENGFMWCTLIPYVERLYLPDPSKVESDNLTKKLSHVSMRTILLSLQNMLSTMHHKKVLFEEEIQDYITCLPVYSPASLQAQVKELVRIVGTGIQLQPPTLLSLARAKLAKQHFGLHKMRTLTVGEIANTKF